MLITVDSEVSTLPHDVASIPARRDFLQSVRGEAATRFQAGQTGIEVSQWFSDQLDSLLCEMIQLQLTTFKLPADVPVSVICVGGNGRRRPAPYSDVDLLIVAENRAVADVSPAMSALVRDCWDTGFQLGHSIRTPDDVISFAREDVQFATSLVEMRHLYGSEKLFLNLQRRVARKVFRDPDDHFVDACVTARREEWQARGDSVNQLEPDVKRSPGGLRDLHLLRWVAYARYKDAHFFALLENNKIRTHELAILNQADEFLTALRLDLHCRAGLKQDVLTRELQLDIVRSRGEKVETDHRKAVEGFMQEYFRQTSSVAEIARRVTETQHRQSILGRLKNAILSRDPDGFSISDETLDVTGDFLQAMRRDPQKVMEVFVVAAERRVRLSAALRKIINKLAGKLPDEPSHKSCSRFRAVLRSGPGLPRTLRMMYETKVLDWLIPEVSEIRCLMQFNQYHSYTVDEHTLKTIDEVVSLADDDSAVGSAYRSVQHKATLHLSLILHDIGKGRDGDHSIIGEKIADETGVRLQTAVNKKQMMMFLVRHHLVMPDLAFRRDITDQALLVDFARLVGAPELLRMLYVLSVADIKAVGPDVWTDWKGDLMADLYNRTMLILSGRPINHLERERLELVRDHVRSAIVPPPDAESSAADSELPEWIDRQLNALPPFYLMMEKPQRIARDLDIIQELSESGIRIEGAYKEHSDTVTYRVFATDQYEQGSFHKAAGVLSGLRMEIHTAQSCTTTDGTLIGTFRVSDNDFIGTVPNERIKDVCDALASVLSGSQDVEAIFRRSGLFRLNRRSQVIEPQPPRISVDNDCSEHHTVIDVFANDYPGLLFTLAETLHRHGLSVELARIATNVDQVVDVFYVVDADDRKLESQEQIDQLKSALMDELLRLQSDWETKES